MVQKWCRNGEAAAELPFLRLAKRSAGVPRKLSGLVNCSDCSRGRGGEPRRGWFFLPPRGPGIEGEQRNKPAFTGVLKFWKGNKRSIVTLGKVDLGQCLPGLLRCYACKTRGRRIGRRAAKTETGCTSGVED